jgi:hypothetical protein
VFFYVGNFDDGNRLGTSVFFKTSKFVHGLLRVKEIRDMFFCL